MARDTVDGHNVFAVRDAVQGAVKRAREKSLPTLIEAKTYRYRGHSMADPAKYRTKEEVEEWKARDPITVVGEKLDSLGFKSTREEIDQAIEAEIMEAVKFAEESPFPNASTAANFAYIKEDY